MDLITRNNFNHVESDLMMNIKSDGTNINTEFEINKSSLKSSSKQNVKQKNQKITTCTKYNTKSGTKSNTKSGTKSNTKSGTKYNTKLNTNTKVSQDDIIKKREKNNYAARKSREKKRLFVENLQKEIEEKNNYIQELEKKLKDSINNFENFKIFIQELKKDN